MQRFIVRPVALSWTEDNGFADFPSQDLILLVGESSLLSAEIRAELENRSLRVRQIIPAERTRRRGPYRFEADFSTLAGVQQLLDLLCSDGQRVGAVLNFLGFDPEDMTPGKITEKARMFFMLLKVMVPELRRSATRGGGWVLTFSALGGKFNLDRPSDRASSGLPGAAMLGVAKTAALEHGDLLVKCIDVDPGLSPETLMTRVWPGIPFRKLPVEVGLDARGCWGVELAQTPLDCEQSCHLDLDPDAVLLATGGARGITAEVVKKLTAEHGCRLILVGRHDRPGPEPAELAGLVDGPALRTHFVRQVQTGKMTTSTGQIECRIKRILREREMRANLDLLEAGCACMEYHALDLRDDGQLEKLIEHIYGHYGRLDGVLHGAGIVDDGLIRDKSCASFEAVFATKARSACRMALTLRTQSLKFVAFFSSVAGRHGNPGQVDYSAANEVLNKLAGQLNHRWPSVRVVSINWGAWEKGMVDARLRQRYEQKGIEPIPTSVGVGLCVQELARPPRTPAEVVVAASIRQLAPNERIHFLS